MKNWKKLQNGSDIRGVAIASKSEAANLTVAEAAIMGHVFALWVAERKSISPVEVRISAGRDSRLTGEELLNAFLSGVESAGARGYDCGIASTPAMFMSTVFEDFRCDGAVMVTASHLPFNRNGFKFFTCHGGLDKTDITKILETCGERDFAVSLGSGFDKMDLMDVYSEFLVYEIRKGIYSNENFEKPLTGMKIVVDAGNGAGGFFVEKVLKPLGADTSGSVFLDPDGKFPNHEPNPENEEAMESIQKAVLDSGADLGIIFDTDVDRSAVVSGSGEIINRNRLIALMAAIVIEDKPGTAIVTDSVTSDGLSSFIEKLGGVHHRFKRGYKNVINESVRLNSLGQDSALAMETSGHGAMKENYFLDDGAYTIVKILIKMARMKINDGEDITELIADLEEPVESLEFRISLKDEDFKKQGEAIIERLKEYGASHEKWAVEPVNHEGVRISLKNEDERGWFLLRLSLHDPVLPLNVESDVQGGVKKICMDIENFLGEFDNIEYDKLKSYLKDQG